MGNIAVRFYRNVLNKPSGMPDDWPYTCREIGNATSYSDESGPWEILTIAKYNQYVLDNLGAFAAYDQAHPQGASYASVPAIVHDSIYSEVQSYLSALTWNIILDGNSLVSDSSLSHMVKNSLPLCKQLVTAADYANVATSGLTTAQLIARASGTVYPLINTSVAISKRIYFVWELTNDLSTGVSANQAVQNYKTLCQGIQSNGISEIWIATCLPRSEARVIAGFEALRQDVNAQLKAKAISEGWATKVLDIGGDTTIGVSGASDDSTLYVDHIHLTLLGQKIAGKYLIDAMNSLAE